MSQPVIVLWRPGDPWRERLWGFARRRWEQAGFEVVVGSSERGLWACRNEGARAAGAWDAALFADADIALADPAQAHAALACALRCGLYVAAYSELRMLGKAATERVLAGAPLAAEEGDRTWHEVWIGAFAISRALWDDCGGYDERFAPYAGQDIAFIQAAGTLGGLDRVEGAAYHLWHEPRGPQGPREPKPGRDDLWPRYTEATNRPEKMRELLAPLRAEWA